MNGFESAEQSGFETKIYDWFEENTPIKTQEEPVEEPTSQVDEDDTDIDLYDVVPQDLDEVELVEQFIEEVEEILDGPSDNSFSDHKPLEFETKEELESYIEELRTDGTADELAQKLSEIMGYEELDVSNDVAHDLIRITLDNEIDLKTEYELTEEEQSEFSELLAKDFYVSRLFHRLDGAEDSAVAKMFLALKKEKDNANSTE